MSCMWDTEVVQIGNPRPQRYGGVRHTGIWNNDLLLLDEQLVEDATLRLQEHGSVGGEARNLSVSELKIDALRRESP